MKFCPGIEKNDEQQATQDEVSAPKKGQKCAKIKIPVHVSATETCFMSIDEIARFFSKTQSPYIRGEIGIFLCPRNMKEYEENMKKHEEIMKEIWRNFEKNKKKYEGLQNTS